MIKIDWKVLLELLFELIIIIGIGFLLYNFVLVPYFGLPVLKIGQYILALFAIGFHVELCTWTKGGE